MSLNLCRGLLAKHATGHSAKVQCSRTLFTRAQSPATPVRKAITSTVLLVGTTLFLVYYFDSRSALHRYVVPPLLRQTLDAETSHRTAVKLLGTGWGPRDMGVDDERLAIELWGKRLSNPIGLAAGFDKDGEAIDGLFDLGFGWVEIGSVTPKPQPGNPRPRVFHLPEDGALINRYGFPSQGHTFLVSRLRARAPSPSRILSINLGKNKSSPPDSIADFLSGIRTFAPFAPVLVINVSSPNTPGLRSLQGRGLLEELLQNATKERDAVAESSGKRARLLLKIAPDLNEVALRDLAEVVRGSAVDGIIVSNTTIARPEGVISSEKHEQGGLSGRPLKPLALHTLSLLRSQLPSSIPIIGCGGISSGADALEYARAGASAVQLYTAFGYGGVGTVRRIKDEVAQELQSLGTTWAEVSREAIERLAWKRPAPAPAPTVSQEVEGVDALIREAEGLKRMLDDVAGRFAQEGKVALASATGSGAGSSGGGSEEDLLPDTLPPVPPPGALP